MQKFKVAGALKALSLSVIIFTQGTDLCATQSGSAKDLDTVKRICQKVVTKNNGQVSQEQLVHEFSLALQDEDVCNGLTSCELKNKEEYIWFFLGIMSMLGVVLTAKLIMMLADSAPKQPEGIVAADDLSKLEETSGSDVHTSKPPKPASIVRRGGGSEAPHSGERHAEPRDIRVNTRELQLEYVDGQLRLVLDTRPGGRVAAPDREK